MGFSRVKRSARRLRRFGLVPALGGCTVQEAPPTVSRMIADAWIGFDVEGDEGLVTAVEDALVVLDVEALGRVDGGQEPLVDADLAGLTFTTPDGDPAPAPDPSRARPLYLADRLACSLEAYERILVHPDQNELYGKYEDYSRSYDVDRARFTSGELDRISWSGEIVTSIPLNGTYVYRFRSETRRFFVPEGLGIPAGPAFASRTWLPFPADWDNENLAFPQDYQLELFVPLSDDELLHVYPVWREMQTIFGDMDTEIVATTTLQQMGAWDDQTSRLCAEGRP